MRRFEYIITTDFLITVFFLSFSATGLFAAEGENKTKKELTKAEKILPEVLKRPYLEYNAERFRDPFRDFLPQGVAFEELPQGSQAQLSAANESLSPLLNVQGLIWGGSFPQAIINNEVIKAGDTIEGVRIIAIDKDGVTGFFNGRQYNYRRSE